MSYRVMVADDEPIMRKAMSSLINWEELDCELVYLASNGQEVMKQMDMMKPHILILDIQMPGMTGIDIAQYVWEQKLPLKVILLTAYSDFSYAQQAIKCGVVDYVVKTGAMEGLVSAVGKAKAELCREQNNHMDGNINILKENFFKSVFDGSLYQEHEIKECGKKMGLDLSGGSLVMVIHFRTEEESEGEKRQRTHKSLLNFLRMVFDSQMVQGVATGKNIIAIVLSEIPVDFREDMNLKCQQIIDMMENFMNMYVYIGISRRETDILQLIKQHENAMYAIGAGFFDEKSKVSYYDGKEFGNKESQQQIEKGQEELYYLLRKGMSVKALEMFHQLLQMQKLAGGPTSNILNSGINIRIRCGKILAQFDKNLYDITGLQGSISNIIHQSRHVSEYIDIMDTIISKTAEYVNVGASRKNVLIYECEKYIEDHYQTCITVADVARNIGASPSYLSRIFREATGETIIYSINKRKIEKAKEYLVETDMKIYEIAEALGFENITYFSHFFKKYTGLSPKDYK